MDFDKYENKLPYPGNSDYTVIYYYKAGKTVAVKTGTEIKYMKGFDGFDLTTCTTEKVIDKDTIRRLREAYNDNGRRLYDLFVADLKEDLGVTDHPKADKLVSLAWERGHSSGYQEVYNEAWNLVDLIR